MGNHRIDDGLEPGGACCPDRFHWAFGDRFNLFGIELCQGRRGVKGERKRSGELAEADPDDENDDHHQRLYGAEGVEDGAGDVIDSQSDPDLTSLLPSPGIEETE